MPEPHYSIAELSALRQSHLVRKPSNLPTIDQWIDTTPQEQLRRNRQSGGAVVKGDENEHPAKRPSLFETRSRHSQTGNRDEIFLGPKMSFMSASAARQPHRTNGLEERVMGEDSKSKNDRTGVKERGFRDREPDRPRERHENGHQDGDSRYESRPKLRARRDSGGEVERGSRFQPRQNGDRNDEATEKRKSSFGRAKFEQSWIRDGPKEVRESEPARDGGERSWRDQDRRKEKDFGRSDWGLEAGGARFSEPTQEDFQKWKEQMKAGYTAEEAPSIAGKENPDTTKADAIPKSAGLPPDTGTTKSLFGIWGDAQSEEKKSESTSTAKAASGAKPKASRFVNLFGSSKVQDTTGYADPLLSAPLTNPNASHATSEDQEGFQRMMEKLRMGNSLSQGPRDEGIALAPAQSQCQTSGPAMHQTKQSASNFEHENGTRHSPPVSTHAHAPQSPAAARPVQNGRPEMPNRDSEFLINLMKQHQPRAPFTEGQIYGQSYHRKLPDDMRPIFNPGTTASPQQERQRGPPPGFFGNNQAFASNQTIDSQVPADFMNRQTVKPSDNYFNQTGQRLPPDSFPPRHHQGPDEQQHQQHQFQQPPHAWQGGQPPHLEHAPPPPLPGFPSSSSGPAPPGFFQFPHPVNLRPSPPPQPPHQLPQHTQSMPPPHPHRQAPGAFFNGPPPGFGPSTNVPQRAAGPHGIRRKPSQQMPPGYDSIYGDAIRRGIPLAGPPPPTQGQYAQYLKQGRGMGAYGGL